MTSAARPNNLAWLPPTWGDWSFPDPKVVNEQIKNEFSEEDRAKAWDDAATAVKTYHDELVEQWQKAMDSLLVYAGLFSAVLTAFNVQSYQLLQPASTDPMLAALQQISAQLNSFSVNPSFINSTQPARSPDQLQLPFRAPVSAVWINTLWFASLVCSLASASIALIVKQWLYEESKGLSGTSRETARLRQYRLNSLIKWKVGAIILVPSVLLQVALFLFLSGLLILLWMIHETVAAVITALIGALFVFVVIVTILPIFKLDCCYRSPQAFAVFVVARSVWNGAGQFAAGLLWLCVVLVCLLSLAMPRHPAGGRLESLFQHIIDACASYIEQIGQMSTWNGAEQTEVARDDRSLDRHIATMAYTTTFATEHLKVIHVILSDLPCDQLFSCFSDIHRSWVHLWGADDAVKRSGKLTEILLGQPFYYALRKALTVDLEERDRTIGEDWTGLSSRYLLSSYNAVPLSAEFLSTLALTAIGDSSLAKQASKLLYLRFYDHLESMPFVITYDILRDVMAVARYNVEHLVAPDEADDWRKLRVVGMSLACTMRVLINNLGLSWEQEGWIYNETRSLLSSLAEKMLSDTEEIWRFLFVLDVLEPLTTTCREVSRGYEMVPEGVLAIQQIWLPADEASPRERWRGHELNCGFNKLESAIRQQRSNAQCVVP